MLSRPNCHHSYLVSYVSVSGAWVQHQTSTCLCLGLKRGNSQKLNCFTQFPCIHLAQIQVLAQHLHKSYRREAVNISLILLLPTFSCLGRDYISQLQACIFPCPKKFANILSSSLRNDTEFQCFSPVRQCTKHK